MSQPGDSLIAVRQDTTTWYSGVGVADSIDMIIKGVENDSWIDSSLGGVTLAVEGAAWLLDPAGMLITTGFAFAVEHIEPLSWCLDQLAGDPDQLRANAQTWRNVAAEHIQIAEDYGRATSVDITGWHGGGALTYRQHTQRSMELLFALSKVAECMAVIVEASSALVEAVRMIVRDLIGECVAFLIARIPLWLAEETFSLGLATPLVEAQISTVVARWAAKIARIMRGLIRSLENLIPVVRQVDTGMGTYLMLARRHEPSGPRSGGAPSGMPDGIGALTRAPDPASQAGDLGLVADTIVAHTPPGRAIPDVELDDQAEYVENIMRGSAGVRVRDTPSGDPRFVWWDATTGTCVIREGNKGTFTVPTTGYAYYLKQLQE